MRKIEYSGQFKRDLKRARKRGKNMDKIKRVMALLIDDAKLPENLHDHALKGNWDYCRDLHIEPDWLLIYRLGNDTLRFERTGSHADLF